MAGKFALVGKVQIEKVDDRTVTFVTRSACKSGNRDECLRRTFTSPISEVWTQPIPGAPPPVAMRPGAVGNLYLSRAGLETRSPDGYQIYGVGTPLVRIKYPDEAAISQPLGELTITPSSIVVRGTLDGGREFHDIELLGPDAAEAQDLRWNGADHIQLRLTSRGAKRLGIADHAATAEVWPTAITVSGAPASFPTAAGSIDILDSELAAQDQHLEYARHGAPISLSLTQDGFAAFHVVPGLLPEAGPPGHRISQRR